MWKLLAWHETNLFKKEGIAFEPFLVPSIRDCGAILRGKQKAHDKAKGKRGNVLNKGAAAEQIEGVAHRVRAPGVVSCPPAD